MPSDRRPSPDSSRGRVPPTPRPNTVEPIWFEFGIGGYFGPSYSLEWQDGCLRYDARGIDEADDDDGDHPRRREDHEAGTVTPTPARWRAFWRTLDRLGVWKWKKSYITRGVCDGTGWSFIVRRGDRVLETGGLNGYPGKKGPEPSDDFERFLRALSRLAGGKVIR